MNRTRDRDVPRANCDRPRGSALARVATCRAGPRPNAIAVTITAAIVNAWTRVSIASSTGTVCAMNPTRSQQQAGRGRQEREQQGFGEDLPNDSPPRRAERSRICHSRLCRLDRANSRFAALTHAIISTSSGTAMNPMIAGAMRAGSFSHTRLVHTTVPCSSAARNALIRCVAVTACTSTCANVVAAASGRHTSAGRIPRRPEQRDGGSNRAARGETARTAARRPWCSCLCGFHRTAAVPRPRSARTDR